MTIRLTIITISGVRSHRHHLTLDNIDDIMTVCDHTHHLIMSVPSGVDLSIQEDDRPVDQADTVPVDNDVYCISDRGSAKYNDHDGFIAIPRVSDYDLAGIFRDAGLLLTWYQHVNERITGITFSYSTVK
jgi:hypothetical protein